MRLKVEKMNYMFAKNIIQNMIEQNCSKIYAQSQNQLHIAFYKAVTYRLLFRDLGLAQIHALPSKLLVFVGLLMEKCMMISVWPL